MGLTKIAHVFRFSHTALDPLFSWNRRLSNAEHPRCIVIWFARIRM